MKKGYVQIYTGNGKGKTTAAIGLALRAAAYGFKIRIIQFLKGGPSGEVESLKKFDTIKLYRVTDAENYIWDLTPEQKADMQNRANEMIIKAHKWFEEGIDILILDEIMAAIKYDIVTLADIAALLDSRPSTTEVIMTGRDAPQRLIERAHLVTEMKDIKHYFDDGVPARRGIEF